MDGNRGLRASVVALAALLLFGAAPGHSADAAGWSPSPGRPGTALAAGNPAVVAAPAALDTRLLSEARPEPGPGASGQEGLSPARSLGPSAGPSGRRAAATAERAAHPERRSGTRLRGPPRLPI